MRTIKFRGKDVTTGKWVYGYYAHLRNKYNDCHCIITNRDVNLDSPRLVMADDLLFTTIVSFTVGQFTGLFDKNGKEIYEGDIIYSEFSDGSHTRCLVGWNDEETCFGIMDEYAYRSKLQGYNFPEFDSRLLSVFRKDGKIFEVIGNIYDNSQLINK